MSIQIIIAVAIHEPMIHRFSGRCPACGDCLAHHYIHLGAAGARQGYDGLGIFSGIANLLFGKCLKKFLDQQHDENVIADDHAGGIFIGEIRVERKAELGKKTRLTGSGFLPEGLKTFVWS